MLGWRRLYVGVRMNLRAWLNWWMCWYGDGCDDDSDVSGDDARVT